MGLSKKDLQREINTLTEQRDLARQLNSSRWQPLRGQATRLRVENIQLRRENEGLTADLRELMSASQDLVNAVERGTWVLQPQPEPQPVKSPTTIADWIRLSQQRGAR